MVYKTKKTREVYKRELEIAIKWILVWKGALLICIGIKNVIFANKWFYVRYYGKR